MPISAEGHPLSADFHLSHRTIQLCLDAARSSSSPHQRSLEGIFWIINTKQHILTRDVSPYRFVDAHTESSSLLCPAKTHLPAVSTSTSLISPNDVSTSTAAEDPDDFAQTPPSSLSTESSAIGIPDAVGALATTPPEQSTPSTRRTPCPWSPPKFLRSRRIDRRNSGDAVEFRAAFLRRCNAVKRQLRHRKSLSDETIDDAAFQGMQLTQLRNSSTHHSNPIVFEPRVYRRCRSAVTVEDVVDSTRSPDTASSCLFRKHSMSCLSFSTAGDVWPETITTLLTGGQTLVDRFLLFGHLESLLCDKPATFAGGYTDDVGLSGDGGGTTEANSMMVPRSLSHEVTKKRCSGLRTWSAGVSIPRPDKKWGGEDAFFTCDESDGFIGVADGVGEWGELGCNPRQFAEELMEGAKREALRLKRAAQTNDAEFTEMRASIRARKVLGAGFHVAKSFGSSTSIVAGLDAEGTTLGVANIGDSSCLVLRRESKRHRHFVAFRRTKEQQHFFNCPYQLSRIPCEEDLPGLVSQGMHGLARALSNLSSRFEGDTPEMADLYDIRVQEGDLVIVATDGVFDNLFDQEIASLVSLAISPHEARILQSTISEADFLAHPNAITPPEFHAAYGMATSPHVRVCCRLRDPPSVQNLAKAIAEAAFYRSMDPRARTPFGRQSRRAGGYFTGGKMDDITVVVAWIV